jgi:hypothetical protein
MVNYQFQFPTHCKHYVTIARTRDAHGGLYKHPNRMGYDAVWLGAWFIDFHINIPSKYKEPHTQRHSRIIQNTLWLFTEGIKQTT